MKFGQIWSHRSGPQINKLVKCPSGQLNWNELDRCPCLLRGPNHYSINNLFGLCHQYFDVRLENLAQQMEGIFGTFLIVRNFSYFSYLNSLKADSHNVHLTHVGAAEVCIAAKIRKSSILRTAPVCRTRMRQMHIVWMSLNAWVHWLKPRCRYLPIGVGRYNYLPNYTYIYSKTHFVGSYVESNEKRKKEPVMSHF